MKFILVDKKPVFEPDILKWAAWMDNNSREVMKTIIRAEKGREGCVVSTVFLGIDHGLYMGQPVLFETLVFPECDICKRYCTWEEAEKGHKELVFSLLGDKK